MDDFDDHDHQPDRTSQILFFPCSFIIFLCENSQDQLLLVDLCGNLHLEGPSLRGPQFCRNLARDGPITPQGQVWQWIGRHGKWKQAQVAYALNNRSRIATKIGLKWMKKEGTKNDTHTCHWGLQKNIEFYISSCGSYMDLCQWMIPVVVISQYMDSCILLQCK